MFVEILLLTLIGVVIFSGYMIIMRLMSADKKIKDLYRLFDEVTHFTHRNQELLLRIHDLFQKLESDNDEIKHKLDTIYGMTNERLRSIEDSLNHIDFRSIENLRQRFIRLETTVVEGVTHIDKLFENINLRFEYFNNRLHLINTKVDYLFPSRKTRVNKKINLTYKIRGHRTLD